MKSKKSKGKKSQERAILAMLEAQGEALAGLQGSVDSLRAVVEDHGNRLDAIERRVFGGESVELAPVEEHVELEA